MAQFPGGIPDRLKNINDEVKELHPLLDILLPKLPNVIDVEYTHGVNEMGADFVLSKVHDILGNTYYVGVIAKLGKIHQDFSDIEKQIDECTIPRFFSGGTNKICITETWVVATENITDGAQKKIHEKFNKQKIEFIQGSRLIKLIDTYMPIYWENLSLGVGEYLTSLRVANEEMDKVISILPITDARFYIEQDIYEIPSFDINSKKKLQKPPDKINIYEEIEKKQVLFIEGDMGSGKSKLIRRLIDHYSHSNIYIEKKLLPIFVTYKELLDEFNCDVDELIQDRLRSAKGETSDSKYFLLIDGVDEKKITVDEQIKTLTPLITNINSRPNVKALITSRYLKGFEQTSDLDQEISRYEIRSLSLNRIIEFISTICSSLNIKDRIIEDLKKSHLFKELPRSPIAAILLASLIKENSKDLPSNMTELYAKYVELVLGRWDIEKGLQKQKEYQALDNIMMELSKYMIENEINTISIDEAKQFFENYLTPRNLDIDSENLFDNMANRCGMVMIDHKQNILAFKHRTFVEFLYAKASIRDNTLNVDDRVFNPYWMSIFFFYLGLKKDCPEILNKILEIPPTIEAERR